MEFTYRDYWIGEEEFLYENVLWDDDSDAGVKVSDKEPDDSRTKVPIEDVYDAWMEGAIAFFEQEELIREFIEFCSEEEEAKSGYGGHIPDDDEEELISILIKEYQDDDFLQGMIRERDCTKVDLAYANISLDISREECKQVQKERDYTKSEFAWAKLEMSVIKLENDRIQKERNDARSSLVEAKKIMVKSQEKYERTLIERDDAKYALANLQRELSISRKQCERIQSERDGLKITIAQTKKDLLDANNIVDSTMANSERVQSALMGKCRRLSAERDHAKNSLAQAEEDKTNLVTRCQRLQNERDEAQHKIEEFCGGNLSLKSMEDLDSMEKQIRLALDRVVKRRGSLIQQKLSEEADKKLCVICQSEPKSVLLMPCKHLCCCSSCSLQVGHQCPLCRQDIILKISNVFT